MEWQSIPLLDDYVGNAHVRWNRPTSTVICATCAQDRHLDNALEVQDMVNLHGRDHLPHRTAPTRDGR